MSYMQMAAFVRFEVRPDPLADTDGALIMYCYGQDREVVRWDMTAQEAAMLAAAILEAIPVDLRNETMLAMQV